MFMRRVLPVSDITHDDSEETFRLALAEVANRQPSQLEQLSPTS